MFVKPTAKREMLHWLTTCERAGRGWVGSALVTLQPLPLEQSHRWKHHKASGDFARGDGGWRVAPPLELITSLSLGKKKGEDGGPMEGSIHPPSTTLEGSLEDPSPGLPYSIFILPNRGEVGTRRMRLRLSYFLPLYLRKVTKVWPPRLVNGPVWRMWAEVSPLGLSLSL